MRGLAIATTEASRPTMITPTDTAARIHHGLPRTPALGAACRGRPGR